MFTNKNSFSRLYLTYIFMYFLFVYCKHQIESEMQCLMVFTTYLIDHNLLCHKLRHQSNVHFPGRFNNNAKYIITLKYLLTKSHLYQVHNRNFEKNCTHLQCGVTICTGEVQIDKTERQGGSRFS